MSEAPPVATPSGDGPSAPRRWARRAARAGGAALALLLLYLLAWPTPLEPVAWTPPPCPPRAPNQALAAAEPIGVGQLLGPESLAFDSRGRLHAGLADGRIVRLSALDAAPETVASTGGRPLGLAFGAADRLFVADAERGLLEVSPAGEVRVRVAEVSGQPLRFANGVAVGRDGTVYFTSSSTRFGLDESLLVILEHAPDGRLLALAPGADAARVLLEGLTFANGVAVAADQRAVFVAEMGKYRVQRYWLAGPRAGSAEVFVEGLGGFPDGLAARPDGGLWVALPAARSPLVDGMLPRPFLRRVVSRLPRALLSGGGTEAWLLGLDAAGRVTHDLQDQGPQACGPVASVTEREGYLYLGSLGRAQCARLRVPPERP
ncbi:MAG: SMP-30/gluconolactonase/LRE family protein [Planctomycetota bacterium]